MTQQPQLEVDLFTPEDGLEELGSGVSVSKTFVRRTGGDVQRSLPFTIAGYNLQRKGMQIPDSPTLTKVYAKKPPSGPEFSGTILTIINETAITTHRPRFVNVGTGINIERGNLAFPVGVVDSRVVEVSKSTLEPYVTYNVSDWLSDQSRKTLLRIILGDVFGPDGNLLSIYENYEANSIYCDAQELSELVVVRGENQQPLSIHFYPIRTLPKDASFRFARYNKQALDRQDAATAEVLPLPEIAQVREGGDRQKIAPDSATETTVSGTYNHSGRLVGWLAGSVPIGAAWFYHIISKADDLTEGSVGNFLKGLSDSTNLPFTAVYSGAFLSTLMAGGYLASEIGERIGRLSLRELKRPSTIGWFAGSSPIAVACVYGIIRAAEIVENIPWYHAPLYALGTVLSTWLGGYLGMGVGGLIESRKERPGRDETRAITLAGTGKDLQYPSYQPLDDPVLRRLLQSGSTVLSPLDTETTFLDAHNTRFEKIKLATQKGKHRRASAYAIGAVNATAGYNPVPQQLRVIPTLPVPEIPDVPSQYSHPIHALVKPKEDADVGEAINAARGGMDRIFSKAREGMAGVFRSISEELYWSEVKQAWRQTHDMDLAVEYVEGLRTHGAFGGNLNYKPHMPISQRIRYMAAQLMLK